MRGLRSRRTGMRKTCVILSGAYGTRMRAIAQSKDERRGAQRTQSKGPRFRGMRDLTAQQRNAFIAAFLGWTLDAFDFFLVVVALRHVASDLHGTYLVASIAVTLTLALRPLGALIFGWFADRYGRRVPLMVDIALYSVLELATAFSPNLTVFIVLRALFGIAMGGEWGVGAALAMEALPAEKRGLFSGILQEGYAVGYLIAAVVLAVLYVHIGWRGMFLIGAL